MHCKENPALGSGSVDQCEATGASIPVTREGCGSLWLTQSGVSLYPRKLLLIILVCWTLVDPACDYFLSGWAKEGFYIVVGGSVPHLVNGAGFLLSISLMQLWGNPVNGCIIFPAVTFLSSEWFHRGTSLSLERMGCSKTGQSLQQFEYQGDLLHSLLCCFRAVQRFAVPLCNYFWKLHFQNSWRVLSKCVPTLSDSFLVSSPGGNPDSTGTGGTLLVQGENSKPGVITFSLGIDTCSRVGSEWSFISWESSHRCNSGSHTFCGKSGEEIYRNFANEALRLHHGLPRVTTSASACSFLCFTEAHLS